ncbi:hypothetical protein [Desulfovibrio gilichinskyi]|uniref:Solute-binding protein family 3/N-terminal domain-containing protein n=1 Tax=Desulfovibrio gilichinskyi TaxID=1519643 RepID=A0A1X7DP27_9BACT|nr:hypothetical protein [Desulfovibrio gilichinskyi]SMF18425.1 hypothetical protein SAMN06295933_2082 [Desulfovibrio gilichinskyi]
MQTIAKERISIAGNTSTEYNYQKLIEYRGGDPLSISDYSSPYSSRPAISLLLLRQALHLGGIDADFVYISCPNPGRSLAEVKKGHAIVYSSDMWEQDFDDSVYKTSPIIRRGEFQKGIYVKKGSPLLTSTNVEDDLKNKIPLVEHTWTIDIALLKSFGFKDMQTAPKYDLLFKMINRNRADFTILEFPRTNDLTLQDKTGDLYPIPNAKIVLPYSRHFMVSKINPQGKRVYEALEKGLEILRKNGTIERALRQSGVINDKVKNWKIAFKQGK